MTAPIDTALVPPKNRDPYLHNRTRYDVLIERWNRRSPEERRRLAALCRMRGHQWEPLSDGDCVCGRCCAYAGSGR